MREEGGLHLPIVCSGECLLQRPAELSCVSSEAIGERREREKESEG